MGERKALGRFLLVSTVFLPALCYENDTFRMLAINLILRSVISNFLPFEKNLKLVTHGKILPSLLHNLIISSAFRHYKIKPLETDRAAL